MKKYETTVNNQNRFYRVKVLVTGATGFLVANLVRILIERGLTFIIYRKAQPTHQRSSHHTPYIPLIDQ